MYLKPLLVRGLKNILDDVSVAGVKEFYEVLCKVLQQFGIYLKMVYPLSIVLYTYSEDSDGEGGRVVLEVVMDVVAYLTDQKHVLDIRIEEFEPVPEPVEEYYLDHIVKKLKGRHCIAIELELDGLRIVDRCITVAEFDVVKHIAHDGEKYREIHVEVRNIRRGKF